jgi:hypothetical protein
VPQTLPSPVPAQSAPISPLLWDTPQNSEHSVRVCCDEAGMTWDEKNVLWACVKQESDFNNSVTHANYIFKTDLQTGQTIKVLASTDYGIVQVNNFYHIGEGKDFPSVDYVMSNPESCVRWMIKCFQTGRASEWCSYSSGAYKQWLPYTG